MGNNQCNVVVLLSWAEPLKLINHRIHQRLCRKVTMPLERLHKPLLTEFFAAGAIAFSNTIGVERERGSRAQWPLEHRAIKLRKQTYYRSGGIQPFYIAIVVQQKRRQITAIGIA